MCGKKAVTAILKPTKRSQSPVGFAEDAYAIFDYDCLSYAQTVYDRLYKRTNSNRTNILNLLLADKVGRYDSEVVALAALCIGAAESANVIRGSNPTW